MHGEFRYHPPVGVDSVDAFAQVSGGARPLPRRLRLGGRQARRGDAPAERGLATTDAAGVDVFFVATTGPAFTKATCDLTDAGIVMSD